MKSQLKYLLIHFVFIIQSTLAFSAGSIEIKGKIHSFSEDKIEISDATHVYIIDKHHLNKDQIKMFVNQKIGAEAQVWVDFRAITDVKKITQ